MMADTRYLLGLELGMGGPPKLKSSSKSKTNPLGVDSPRQIR